MNDTSHSAWPCRHAPCADVATSPAAHPLAGLPQFDLAVASQHIPSDAQCFALWDKYGMLEHIRRHSLGVAEFAAGLAQRAVECGYDVNVPAVRASALLHDIAKTYTITHGGSHAQIGASWVILETGNHELARGVLMHVHWPWDLPENVCSLPFFVIYADKRIKHDQCVTLDARFEDLLVRYGVSEAAKASIRESYTQGQLLERAFNAQLRLDLNAYTLDSGRLVQRA